MGRLAKLNKAGLLQNKRTNWIIVTKTDFSYELQEDTAVADVKTTKKVVNLFYVPFAAACGKVIPFGSQDEAREWLREFVNTIDNQKVLEHFYGYTVRLLQVKNVPSKRKGYNQDWAAQNLLKEVEVNTKDLKSSKIL